jgi:hypothetical protein
MTLRGPFDRAVGGLQTFAQYLNDSEAPLKTYGANEGRVNSLLNQSINDIKNAVDYGPPFSLSDIVRACMYCTMVPYPLVSLRYSMLWPILVVP